MTTNKNKPIAHQICTWGEYKEILYKCPKCNTDFRIFKKQMNYCFGCGMEIDWNVLTELKISFNGYYSGVKKEKLLLEKINQENKHRTIYDKSYIFDNTGLTNED